MAERIKHISPVPILSTEPESSILLVDDVHTNLVVLRALLDGLGHNLVEAHSGEEAIERVKSGEFAVILLDVLMPGINGFETAKAIRGQERSQHTPIIFLTASDINRSQIEEGYALGAVDFLVKPLVLVVLQAKVRGFVELFQDRQRTKREADQLRLLVHGTTEYAIFMLDPHGFVVTWNQGAERFKGYKAAEIIGQHFTKFYPQEAIDRGWPAHELKVATTEGRFEDEGWRVRKDGTQFWANVVITALRDEQGELCGFSKVTRDLTERKKAEESLRQSEERFRLLVEGAKDYAIFLLDAQGHVASWNTGAERIKGYRADEIIGQHFSRFYPQDAIDRGWPAHELATAKAEGRFEDEGWRVRKDGTQFWANVVITALHDDAAKFRGFSKITRDMTERKKAEENGRRLLEETTARRLAEENAQVVQEQRARLHVTLSSIGDAVISTDADCRIEFLNPIAEELVGWTTAEAMGRNLEDVFKIVNEDTCLPVENPVARVLKEGRAVGLANHTVLVCRDGTERPIDDSAAPIKAMDGSTLGVVLVFRDITELRRAERESRRNEAVLASQKRVLELLVQGAPLPDVLDALCEVIEGQSQDRLVATVLLLDEGGGRLRSVAGRRVPAEYARAVDGVVLGPCAGSCGTAAFRGEPVVVTDIAADPLWANYRELALRHGLRACWSTPILSSHGRVLGTFAVYYPTPRGPTEGERRLADILTSTAGVAIERRRAEAALRESEQTARFLAEASAALAVLVDFDSTLQKVASLAVPSFADWASVDLVQGEGTLRRVAVAHANPAKVELAHELHRRFPPDPAAPRGVWSILRTGRGEIVPEISEELLIQSVKDDELVRIIRELGLKSYLGVPLKVRGKAIGVITFIAAESGRHYSEADLATAQDLADRAAIAIDNSQLYRELREADRRKDEFLATLAHELRNPLAPIRNGLQVLRLAGGGGTLVDDARSMMERQLSQMVRLVDDLLDVSRITRDKLELRRKRVTLAEVIHSAVETSRPLIEQAGHAFSLTLPPASVYLDADPTRLAQVFSNLLNNAAKYTEHGGRISLTGDMSGGEVVVRVRDNGLGIPADALPRVFEMFSQVDRNLERAQGGLGIGLTLVRRLVEMHGGTVEARSGGLRQGSEFVVRLPVLQTAQTTSAHPDNQSVTATTKRRILVVDDNRDSATSLGMMLNLMGNETHTAYDGLAAVEAAEKVRPDMILLDIGLPRMNGYEACRAIRQQSWSKGMFIVALTGWGQEGDRRRSAEAGFDHHMVKPVEVDAMAKLLATPGVRSFGVGTSEQGSSADS